MTTTATTTPRLRPARPVLSYLAIDVRRTVLNPVNLFFVVLFPPAMYLLFGAIQSYADTDVNEHGNVAASVMLAMASYSACLGSTSSTSATAVELSGGWGRQMALTRSGLRGYWGVKLATASFNALIPIAVVMVAGAFTAVRLDAQGWVLGLLLSLLGTVPFALWGLAMGSLLPPQNAVGIATSLVTLFGFLGNAFMPLSGTLLAVGRLTPMYGASALARWPLTQGTTYTYSGGDTHATQEHLWVVVANLVVWTLVFAALVVAARRRSTRRA